MIVSRDLESKINVLKEKFPILTVTGPRQSGKTTLCRELFSDRPYVSLESPEERDRVESDPRGFLNAHADGAVIDEVQRYPDLLSYLQVEVDERRTPGRFILTGSANFSLLASVTQSLAGRTAVLELLPLGHAELLRFAEPPEGLLETLWSGAYPAVFDRVIAPGDWYDLYVTTYVERDVRQILNVGDLQTFQKFLRLCAGRTAQLVNLSDLAADCGITHNTARSWLSVLEASYLVHRLPVYRANVSSRLIKTPKLHFVDSGLVCYLLGIREPEQLRNHPQRGAIFESWVVAEVLKARRHHGEPARLHYFRNRKKLEVDLVVDLGLKLLAVEAKSGETVPGDAFRNLERFKTIVGEDPMVQEIESFLVYGGAESQRRTVGRVLPWGEIADEDWRRQA